MVNEGEKNMTIEERLENMERELGLVKRRNRWLLSAILVLLGGLVTTGVFKTMIAPVQAQGEGTVKEIRAKRIVLEDESGQTRTELTVDKDGPDLRLFDESGKRRCVMGVDKEGSFLYLFDDNSKAGAGLSILKDGPTLSLFDEKGEARAGLVVRKDGSSLALYDKNGTTRFEAGKAKTMTPDGKTIEYPESSLILYGPDGKVLWSAIK
jgi:hypothetical protein